MIQHEGSSINPNRQEGPHAHCIMPDPSSNFVFAVDLGLDQVVIYALDRESGVLKPNETAFVAVEPGSGPRHFDFHPDGRHAFVINELNSTLTAFDYDAGRGVLSPLNTISTLPVDFSENNSCADLHVHPGGRFLYGSNRGHNSIVVATFDPVAGSLTLVGHASTQGSTPRNFTLDPSGRFLLAANQRSDTVVSFEIDQASGLLTPTGQTADAPTPVCLKFA
jgi:6-phosphogluconolactonase